MQSERPADELDDAAIEAELDREEFAADQQLRKLGTSDAEIARMRGKASPADLAKPPPTLAEVEREINELMELKRSDRRKYWADETQARHLALIEMQEKLKAEGATEEAEADQGGRIGDDLPEALREAWSKEPDGVAGNIEAIKNRTVLALGELDEAEHDGLLQAFDEELSDDERTVIATQLAEDHGNAWRGATDDEVQAFAETEWGAQALQRWGRQGPKLLGVAKKEADGILGRLTATSRLKVERWIAAKSANQRRAIVEILAARAMRGL
jgi:hypothetical protein